MSRHHFRRVKAAGSCTSSDWHQSKETFFSVSNVFSKQAKCTKKQKTRKNQWNHFCDFSAWSRLGPISIPSSWPIARSWVKCSCGWFCYTSGSFSFRLAAVQLLWLNCFKRQFFSPFLKKQKQTVFPHPKNLQIHAWCQHVFWFFFCRFFCFFSRPGQQGNQ